MLTVRADVMFQVDSYRIVTNFCILFMPSSHYISVYIYLYMYVCMWLIPTQNPQSDLQAQDRCHRIGQNRPVVVYRLVTANTVDQKIVERASAKRKLEKIVIHKGDNILLCGFLNS